MADEKEGIHCKVLVNQVRVMHVHVYVCILEILNAIFDIYIIMHLLIRQVNKRKQLIWCKEQQRTEETFSNVIFADEYTVQLEQHSRICFRKKFQQRTLKQRGWHLH